jgi:hypothetical protein
MATNTNRTRPAAKSKGRAMKKDHPGEGPSSNANPTRSRAQRDDTPEARSQRSRTPKTHPTRAPGASRKDRKGLRRDA